MCNVTRIDFHADFAVDAAINDGRMSLNKLNRPVGPFGQVEKCNCKKKRWNRMEIQFGTNGENSYERWDFARIAIETFRKWKAACRKLENASRR